MTSDEYRRCHVAGCAMRPTTRLAVYVLAIREPDAPNDIASEHETAIYACNDHTHPRRIGLYFVPLEPTRYPLPPT